MKSRISSPLLEIRLPSYVKPVAFGDTVALEARQGLARQRFSDLGFELLIPIPPAPNGGIVFTRCTFRNAVDLESMPVG